MTSQPLPRQGERAVEGFARCRDCPWNDDGGSFRMLAGQHHKTTGHEVVTEATTTYQRASVGDPAQSTIFDFIESDAA